MMNNIGLRLYYKKDDDKIFINTPIMEKEIDLDGYILERVEMKLPLYVNRLSEKFMEELLILLKDKDIEYVDKISGQLQIICRKTIYQEYFIDNCNKYDYNELEWIINETLRCLNEGGN